VRTHHLEPWICTARCCLLIVTTRSCALLCGQQLPKGD
jgi:hypothetical protein